MLMQALAQRLAGLDASKLTITKTTKPKTPLAPEQLQFGRSFTDHMLIATWTATAGWSAPSIRPYADLCLDPAACALHYASQCFEGMKAYRSSRSPDSLRLFRPDRNMARLNASAARLALPTVDGGQLLALLAALCNLEQRFVPAARGCSLYVRPTILGTDAALGVAPPARAVLYAICSPCGPSLGGAGAGAGNAAAMLLKAMSLETSGSAIVRAWPGGTGDAKVGANYAGGVVAQRAAAEQRGCAQVLWVFGEEEWVTEAGSMNVFAAIEGREGRRELVTAPLDGTILEGVTRDSVLELARERLVGWDVVERKFSMVELVEAADEGRLLEVFGCGTAVVVSPVRSIYWKRKERWVNCGLKEDEEAGPVAKAMFDWILSIQHGEEEHPWSRKI